MQRRRKPIAARIGLGVGATLVALLLAEVAVRLLRPDEHMLPHVPGTMTLRPGPHLEGCTSPVHWHVNALGLRGDDDDPGAYATRILCVGGSTTKDTFITQDRSWPYQVQSMLREGGVRAYVGNAGRSGQYTAQHTALIRDYSHTGRFDTVITLVGINELWQLLTEVPRDLSPARIFAVAGRTHWSALVHLVRKATASSLDVSRFTGIDERAEFIVRERRNRREALAKKRITALPPDWDARVRRYRDDLRELIGVCRERGLRHVVCTQPTLYQDPMPPALEATTWVTFTGGNDAAYASEALARGMADINRATREVCEETATSLVPLDERVPKQTTHLYDHCHFNNRGSEAAAREIATFLLQMR